MKDEVARLNISVAELREILADLPNDLRVSVPDTLTNTGFLNLHNTEGRLVGCLHILNGQVMMLGEVDYADFAPTEESSEQA